MRNNKYLRVQHSAKGTWITPINPETKALDADKATSVVTADYGHYKSLPATLCWKETWWIDQEGRTVRADKVTIDKNLNICTCTRPSTVSSRRLTLSK